MGAAPTPAAEVSCEDQGLEMGKFFETPSIELGDVTISLKTDADSDSREESGGPLVLGGKVRQNPAVVVALLDAGADEAMRDRGGNTPFDLVRNYDEL